MDTEPALERKESLPSQSVIMSATRNSIQTKRDALLLKLVQKAKEAAKKLKASDFDEGQVEEIVETLSQTISATVEARDIRIFTQELINTKPKQPLP